MFHTAPLLLLHILVCGCLTTQMFGDWNPKIYCAIKWTAPNQGKATIDFAKKHNITQVPVAYHGGVDTNASGEITQQNIEQFTNWIDTFIPPEYCGPIVLDYEQPWWKELRAKSIEQDRLKEILSVYITGIRVARKLQPNGQWGYWGLPSLRHTAEPWLKQGRSLEPLFRHCKALYPEVYDCHPKLDRSAQAQQHIATSLKQAAGRIPVYVFVSPRYCGEGRDNPTFISDEAFLRQVNAAMQASWIDASGNTHKIKGVILWDAYGYTPNSGWDDLDQKHVHYFELLQTLATAWTQSMVDKIVFVEPTSTNQCQDGLPMPHDSDQAIFDREHKSKHNRVPDTKVRGNRVVDDVPSQQIPR